MEFKEEEGSHDNSERWLLTYSDMITLLMIFFIIMYAVSRVDVQKFSMVKEAFGIEFGTKYIIGKSPGKSMVEMDSANLYNAEEIQKMSEVQAKLQEAIKQAGLQDKVYIFLNERGLNIRVEDALFFQTGSAEISPEGKKIIDKLGIIMKTLPNYVHVEGHTDNVPIHNQQFSSNWRLSTARATNVVEELINGAGYDPHLLSATGYGEYRPIDSNDTPQGRQNNRRVDIVIIKTVLNKSEPQNKQ